MTRPDDHPTELLPDSVLGTLDPAQQGRVDTHLLSCAVCRAEVARLQDALFSLADDLPDTPAPEGSWEKIQARRSAASAQKSFTQAPPPSAPSKRLPVWPLAAAIALIVALGGYLRLSPAQPVMTAQNSVQSWQHGARRLTLASKAGEPYGFMYVRPDGRALLVLNKKAAPGQVYQAWGRQASGPRAGVPISLGLTDGTVLEVSWRGYDSVGVSVEPTGGSPAPTHPLGRTKLPES
ncbi:anti-sigma factor (plasmid) [Deinococcus sp. KNUC1210]|uniref:anti-sigma factor n=1 Tax=Deinococcus sp. KNUC1210 TaxID=2917691 RepID=UPI001EF040A3|nr:anti-sigma factor [Deinococcus sp. KNUC1210]ULH17854.1 anti-sigma factor [Deinococcus sp. KNUC1210]